jgi:hypothetical protein
MRVRNLPVVVISARPSFGYTAAMAKCLIRWRIFLMVLRAMPPSETAKWLDRFSFDDTGALLIEQGQSSEHQTSLVSAFVPSNTIH